MPIFRSPIPPSNFFRNVNICYIIDRAATLHSRTHFRGRLKGILFLILLACFVDEFARSWGVVRSCWWFFSNFTRCNIEDNKTLRALVGFFSYPQCAEGLDQPVRGPEGREYSTKLKHFIFFMRWVPFFPRTTQRSDILFHEGHILPSLPSLFPLGSRQPHLVCRTLCTEMCYEICHPVGADLATHIIGPNNFCSHAEGIHTHALRFQAPHILMVQVYAILRTPTSYFPN